MKDKKRVLILCTGNSARSQMAEGLLRHDAGERFEVESAGTKPGSVRPEAIAAMLELGIDISGHRSKPVEEFEGQHFDYVITVCDNARESCPVFFGAADRLHHRFDDPAAFRGSEAERLAVFRPSGPCAMNCGFGWGNLRRRVVRKVEPNSLLPRLGQRG